MRDQHEAIADRIEPEAFTEEAFEQSDVLRRLGEAVEFAVDLPRKPVVNRGRVPTPIGTLSY
jgi:hypothetical protein